jgi:TRAP-type C4-dicarboxylate transport system permease small subunit
MKLMNKIIDALYEKVFTPLLNILCLIMLITTFVAIISRYVFHYAIIWSPEVSRYLYIYIIFIGTFLGIKHKKHIGLDIVVDRLPNKIKKVVEISRNLSMMVFFIFLAYLGFKFSVIGMSQMTLALGISKGWIYLVIPIGAIFMFISTFQQTLRSLSKVKSGGKEDERKVGVFK